jgi:DNA-binding winged helix-turn-helix (wHTH) protein/predicted ATPase
MGNGTRLLFNPFVLDTPNRSLLRGTEKIVLRPKTFSVLDFLVRNPHRLVTKSEIMSALWPGTKVVDAALRVSVQEIRKALNDDAEQPKFIETVGKSGYRWIAPVTLRSDSVEPGGTSLPTYMVGRQSELELLQGYLERVNGGRRRVVFVTGEPGIGKTTLVGSFLSHAQANDGVLTTQGQCIEQYGSGEAYLPILDALEGLCGTNSNGLAELLRRYAPSWLANLPGLADPAERSQLKRRSIGIAAERRMREIGAFLEAIAKDRTIILVLANLHWVDPSTLALISFLARRERAARLMLIGTYRDTKLETMNPPLRQTIEDLELHNYCSRLSLGNLSRTAVGEYLGARFASPQVSDELLSAVYQRSKGNPLFMVNVTDYLISTQAIARHDASIELSGDIDERSTPSTIRQLIERQLEDLSPEDQDLLEAASIAGTRFSPAEVAAALKEPEWEVENRCARLAQLKQFLEKNGTAVCPDGTATPRYSFVHDLYRSVVYERISASRRARLHQVIGEQIEAGCRGATEQAAAELAVHFERSGDHDRAVQYLLQTAQRAMAQCAYQEAIEHAMTALIVLKPLAATARRIELRLKLELFLGVSLAAAKGYAATEAKEVFSRARALSRNIGNGTLLFQSLAGLWSFHLMRGELHPALELAEEMLQVAERTQNPGFYLNGHMAMGLPLFYLGRFPAAHDHLEKSSSYHGREKDPPVVSVYSWNPGVIVACYKAQTFWLLGYPEKALKEAETALQLAGELATPFHSALAAGLLATYHAYRRDPISALEWAGLAIELSEKYGFSHWLALGVLLQGWALAKSGEVDEGISRLQTGIKKWNSTGAAMSMPTFHALLADAYQAGGHTDKALLSVEEGLATSKHSKESCYDAELYRLKGDLLTHAGKDRLSKTQVTGAENNFRQAIQTARHQKAKFLELRATVGLARFWKSIGKRKQAYAMLAQLCAWFTGGLNSPELVEALELLKQLS